MEQLILSVDTGIDDFITITIAGMRKDKFKIEGICTTYGNCDLENATNNTLQALDIANCNNISVFKGSERPLSGKKMRDATDVHGNNGLGNLQYTEIHRNPELILAEDFLINKVREEKDKIVIIATGPLTDIAKAIKKDKDFSKNLKGLIIMGGGIEGGNITEYAEFNFYQDPEAAQIVFESGIKDITMIGLDVANKNTIDEKIKNFVAKIETNEAKFISKLLSKLEESILYDPLTICYLIDKNILKIKPLNIRIETKGIERGRTTINKIKTMHNCNVAYDIDIKRARKVLLENIFNVEVKNDEI